MFERVFQKAIHNTARLLFAAALVMVVWGFAYALWVLSNQSMTGPPLSEHLGWIGAMLTVFAGAFAPAAQLLFGAAVIHHLDLWLEHRRQQ